MYSASKIYEQIEKAWRKKGCSNAKQFCEYAKERGIPITAQTISRWKHGSVPGTQLLLDICNVCDCDISYIIGDVHSNTTYGINYIVSQTGLSEEAINKLVSCDELYDLVPRLPDESYEDTEKFVKEQKSRVLKLISNMILHEDFIPLVYKILTVSRDWNASRSLSSKVLGSISNDSVKTLRMKSHRTAREDELLLSLYDVEAITTDYVEQIIQKNADNTK